MIGDTWLLVERHMQLRDCVCGRQVRADRRDPYFGVARHNRTPEHMAWRKANGL